MHGKWMRNKKLKIIIAGDVEKRVKLKLKRLNGAQTKLLINFVLGIKHACCGIYLFNAFFLAASPLLRHLSVAHTFFSILPTFWFPTCEGFWYYTAKKKKQVGSNGWRWREKSGNENSVFSVEATNSATLSPSSVDDSPSDGENVTYAKRVCREGWQDSGEKYT